MLYVNSNNKYETYTAYQALTLNTPLNGGVIVPLHLPVLSKKELAEVFNTGFFGSIAFVLNKFFYQKITTDDISLVIGDYMPSSELLDRKTLLIYFEGKLQSLEDLVLKHILGNDYTPVLWARCAVRISLIFGIFRELLYCGIRSLDFAVSSDDPHSLIPVLYGKLMGLPINKIIIAASSENDVWNYLHKGLSGDAEVCQYFIYAIRTAGRNVTARDFYCAVVSNERAQESTTNLRSTYKKSVELTAAASYGALQDYRAITGENRTTIILNH